MSDEDPGDEQQDILSERAAAATAEMLRRASAGRGRAAIGTMTTESSLDVPEDVPDTGPQDH